VLGINQDAAELHEESTRVLAKKFRGRLYEVAVVLSPRNGKLSLVNHRSKGFRFDSTFKLRLERLER
jgi:hypothetical protein